MKIISEGLVSTKPKDVLDSEGLKDAIRKAIIAELDAVNLYKEIASKTDNESVKKVMLDVAKEENIHVGEFQKLLSLVAPEELDDYETGKKEAEDKL